MANKLLYKIMYKRKWDAVWKSRKAKSDDERDEIIETLKGKGYVTKWRHEGAAFADKWFGT